MLLVGLRSLTALPTQTQHLPIWLQPLLVQLMLFPELQRSGASAAGDSTVTIGAGFETLNIGSSGTAGTAGTITFGGATVNFTGSANLTVRNAFEAAADTFDASAFTGNLSIIAGAVADNTNVNGVDVADITLTGGTGNDDFDLSNVVTAREIGASMGAGNDTALSVRLPLPPPQLLLLTSSMAVQVLTSRGCRPMTAITAAGSTGVLILKPSGF